MKKQLLAAAGAGLFLFSCAGTALANPWVLLVQPAPYSQNPPPYGQWQPYQQFESRNQCIEARMRLHYALWESDRDLSMRALSGVCRDDETGAIVTTYDGVELDDDDDF